jgi:hypothetical protein
VTGDAVPGTGDYADHPVCTHPGHIPLPWVVVIGVLLVRVPAGPHHLGIDPPSGA